jgi:hypothetical protein
MNDLNGTVAIPGLLRKPHKRAGGDNNTSTSTHRSNCLESTNQSSANPNKPPPIRLDGIFTSLRRATASQRPQFAKVIVDSSRTMLPLDREIRTRLNTLAKFSSSYFNKDDVDDNGKPREKTFIPISLKTKLVLNSSALVQNDGLLADELAAIMTAQRGAIATHEEFKLKAATSMNAMAEAEINARRKLLLFEYTRIMFLDRGRTHGSWEKSARPLHSNDDYVIDCRNCLPPLPHGSIQGQMGQLLLPQKHQECDG